MADVRCINCKHCEYYHTGYDEYPANTSLAFCQKGHWENCESKQLLEEDVNCNDFEQLTELKKS